MRKAEEIELLTKLLKADSYFATTFDKDDIARMQMNITSDFHIFMGTKMQNELDELRQKDLDKTNLELRVSNLLAELMGMGRVNISAMEALLLSDDDSTVNQAYKLFDIKAIVLWKMKTMQALNDLDRTFINQQINK